MSTRLLLSAMMTTRSDATATIFSRSNAPPPPLMSRSSSSISSAPSTVRSRAGCSIERRQRNTEAAACARVASDVGTQTTFRPLLHFGAEQLDEFGGGRTGAEAELHAVFNVAHRLLGRLPLPVVAAHACPQGVSRLCDCTIVNCAPLSRLRIGLFQAEPTEAGFRDAVTRATRADTLR